MLKSEGVFNIFYPVSYFYVTKMPESYSCFEQTLCAKMMLQHKERKLLEFPLYTFIDKMPLLRHMCRNLVFWELLGKGWLTAGSSRATG